MNIIVTQKGVEKLKTCYINSAEKFRRLDIQIMFSEYNFLSRSLYSLAFQTFIKYSIERWH